MPDVVGMQQGAAMAALNSVGIAVVTVEGAYPNQFDWKLPSDQVVAQAPAPGAFVNLETYAWGPGGSSIVLTLNRVDPRAGVSPQDSGERAGL